MIYNHENHADIIFWIIILVLALVLLYYYLMSDNY